MARGKSVERLKIAALFKTCLIARFKSGYQPLFIIALVFVVGIVTGFKRGMQMDGWTRLGH